MNLPFDLNPEHIDRLLKTKLLGRESLRVVAQTDSTNVQLLESCRHLPEGAVFVADQQTSGRGRVTREWISQPGKDLLFSFLLRPKTDVVLLPSLVLAVGVAAHDAIQARTKLPLRLKWPNDILVDGKKICGILCQTILAEKPTVVVGVGINVNTPLEELPLALQNTATSLAILTGEETDRGKLLVDFLFLMENWYSEWGREPQTVFSMWEDRAILQDRTVEVVDKARRYRAKAMGLDKTGRLIVMVGQQRRTVACGDVHLLEE